MLSEEAKQISHDDVEPDMVKFALINTFESIKEKIHRGDFEWATPSFLKTLRKARSVMPEERKDFIALLDYILKKLPEGYGM